MPEENAFVRSDHYAFVKKGVPALMLLGGPAGDVSIWIPRAKKWLETDYLETSAAVQSSTFRCVFRSQDNLKVEL